MSLFLSLLFTHFWLCPTPKPAKTAALRNLWQGQAPGNATIDRTTRKPHRPVKVSCQSQNRSNRVFFSSAREETPGGWPLRPADVGYAEQASGPVAVGLWGKRPDYRSHCAARSKEGGCSLVGGGTEAAQRSDQAPGIRHTLRLIFPPISEWSCAGKTLTTSMLNNEETSDQDTSAELVPVTSCSAWRLISSTSRERLPISVTDPEKPNHLG